ncbi:hypothetical protein SAMN05421827_107184 [Pedobacter terrae]|uniref:Uncharacterized protein n=1 Tax=Pedobacter terrae TaxID=405671 RepID=A0A1G7UZM3_9SPHI|nr:hypothetical protein SAMN05421827_107184 [Pedobacter terrae]
MISLTNTIRWRLINRISVWGLGFGVWSLEFGVWSLELFKKWVKIKQKYNQILIPDTKYLILEL